MQSSSLWSDYLTTLPPITDEFVIADFQCEEFAALVNLNTDPSTKLQQMRHLFELLDRDWEQHFKKFTTTRVSANYNISRLVFCAVSPVKTDGRADGA